MIKTKLCILSLAMCVLCLFQGCNMPTFTLCSGASSRPEECISDFFDCLKKEDYSTADSYLFNLSTLGFSGEMPEGLYSQLFTYLRDSRTFSVVGESVIDGRSSYVTIDLTVLDFRKIEDKLGQEVTQRVYDIEFDGVEVDDTMLAELTQTVLAEIMMNPGDHCTTERFTLELRLQDSAWKLVCTDKLYSALLGYII